VAANTSPIFVKQPSIQWITGVTTANTDTSMSTGTSYLVFTADATNGSKIETCYIQHLGTNVATLLRFFVNNGSSVGTGANNSLVHEEAIAINTVNQTIASTPVVWQANLYLKPGYKLYCTVGTTISAGLQVSAMGGDY
jgi:hypothetical protein